MIPLKRHLVSAACLPVLIIGAGCIEVKWPWAPATHEGPAAEKPATRPGGGNAAPATQPGNDWVAIGGVLLANMIMAFVAARQQAIKHGYWKQRAKRLENGSETERAPPADQT